MRALSTNTTIPIEQEDQRGGDGGFTLSEIVLAVGIFFLMVGIGASCERELFLKMFRNRKAFKAAMIGVACQFIIMPVLTFVLALVFGIRSTSPYATLGFVLVGCMPGGGSSNMWTLWSGGVLELSVFMTLVSTILSFGLTPFWIWLFSTQAIGLEAKELAFDQIALSFALLLVPLSIGWALNWKFIHTRYKNKIVTGSSVLAISIFVATIVLVGLDFPHAFASNWQYYIPAVCLFPFAAVLSRAISNVVFKLEPALCRTIVMEVGIQNLSLGLSIGYAMVNDESLLNEVIPFPLLYVIFMYTWAVLFIPIFQYQKYYNKRNNITDIDSVFFGKMQEDLPVNENDVIDNERENYNFNSKDDDDKSNNSVTSRSEVRRESDV